MARRNELPRGRRTIYMIAKKREELQGKKWMRAVIFFMIAALLFLYLNQVFNIAASDDSKQIFKAFYAEEENTLDVVYLGTSATNRYFIGPKAYHDAGIAAFDLATMGLPMLFVPNLIDEVEKTQDPDLYIIELRGILKSKDDVTDAHIRRVTDSMRISLNKYDTIEAALDYVEGADGELSDIDTGSLDYYVPIVKYHGRLVQGDLRIADFLPVDRWNLTKGYVLSPNTVTVKAQGRPVYSAEKAALAPEMEDVFLDVLAYCDTLDKDVLFVLSPYVMKDGQAEKFNTAKELAEQRGYPVLDFNQKEITDAMDLDWQRDFYNSKHVNYMGAEKYTAYLTEYLTENYGLADRRGAKDYASWDEAYETYFDFVSRELIFDES